MTILTAWLGRAGVIRRPAQLRCSFCRRPATEVQRLVAGASAYICDGCIAKCVAIIEEHRRSGPDAPSY